MCRADSVRTQTICPIQKPVDMIESKLVQKLRNGRTHKFEEMRADIIEPGITSSFQDSEQKEACNARISIPSRHDRNRGAPARRAAHTMTSTLATMLRA